MPDLLAGEIITAADTPPTVADRDDTSVTAFTNTSYAAGGTVCGTAFTAPTSGRVVVYISAYLDTTDAGGQCFASYRIGTDGVVGAGTQIVAPNDARAILQTGTSQLRTCIAELVEGLTPGATYNAQIMHRHAGAGTSDINWRHILILPTS